jgi:PAS domain S-box-containing protein
MFLDLIQNVALLITLSALYGLAIQFRERNPMLWKVSTGLWFGFTAIIGMMMPFVYETGIIYDGRSIILALAGLFGGIISSSIAALIALIYRIAIGGPGEFAGISTIVFCTLAGLLFRYRYELRSDKLTVPRLLFVGVVVHIIMLASQLLLLPWPSGIHTISRIWVPIMLIFPPAFLVIGLIMSAEERRLLREREIREEESLIRTTLYSIGEGVITLDPENRILNMNGVAENLTGWPEKDAKMVLASEVFHLSGESPELILTNRQGLKIPIQHSSNYIRDEQGKNLGKVLIFRDQTPEFARRKELRESEAKYRELVESTDAIAWEYDVASDTWTYIAPQVATSFGWTPSEWTNRGFWEEKIHPGSRKVISVINKTCILNGKSATLEYQFRTKSGTYLWLRDSIVPQKRDDGSLILRGAMLDLTDRKKMELDLTEKNDFIQTVLDNLPIGIALNKIDEGTALYMNKQFQETYGWPESDLTDVAEFFQKVYPDPVYRENLIARIMGDIQSGDPARMHWENIEITRQDGSRAIINAVNIPLFQQNIMVSTVIDITEQWEAEMALKESEEKFRKLFENHRAVHLLIDPETQKIENANRAAVDYYGWSLDELTQMHVDQINIMSKEEIKEAIESALLHNRHHFDFRHKLANGEVRDVEIYSSRVEILGKVYLHSIIHDVTEKKNLLHELIKAKEKAEENDMLKSAFLANMSHEIRTPLNGILGFTDLITEEEDLPPAKRRQYSSIINRSAGSLMQIIDDILDLSKLETGQLNINLSDTRIQSVLEDLYALFERKKAEMALDEVELIVENEIPDLVLKTDRNRLIQVYSNLLDNAFKFTHKGSIRFGVSRDLADHYELFVADTGIGIPKEKHEVIFDRFTQAGRDIAKTYGGTGLGLSIVKKLLTLMGGTISVDSEPGHGTRFTFTLPK